jgi:hypothetical protein
MRMAVATRTSPDVGDIAHYRQRGKVFMQRDMSPQLLYGFVESAHTIHSIVHAVTKLVLLVSMRTFKADFTRIAHDEELFL